MRGLQHCLRLGLLSHRPSLTERQVQNVTPKPGVAMLHLNKALVDDSGYRHYQTTSFLVEYGRLMFKPLQNDARLRHIMTREATGCFGEGFCHELVGSINSMRIPGCGGAIRDYQIREGNVDGREHRVDGVFPAYGGTTRDRETTSRGLSGCIQCARLVERDVACLRSFIGITISLIYLVIPSCTRIRSDR